MTAPTKSAIGKMRAVMRARVAGWMNVDPAVAAGLFGTGVGMALPVALPPRD